MGITIAPPPTNQDNNNNNGPPSTNTTASNNADSIGAMMNPMFVKSLMDIVIVKVAGGGHYSAAVAGNPYIPSLSNYLIDKANT